MNLVVIFKNTGTKEMVYIFNHTFLYHKQQQTPQPYGILNPNMHQTLIFIIFNLYPLKEFKKSPKRNYLNVRCLQRYALPYLYSS